MKTTFTKSDLESGQLVETRDGRIGLILSDRKIIVAPNSSIRSHIWGDLEVWNVDLTSRYSEKSDIVKVYDFSENYSCSYDKKIRVLLWKREPEKTVSIKGKLYSENTILLALQEYCKKQCDITSAGT